MRTCGVTGCKNIQRAENGGKEPKEMIRKISSSLHMADRKSGRNELEYSLELFLWPVKTGGRGLQFFPHKKTT